MIRLLDQLAVPQRRALDLVTEVAAEKDCRPYLVGGPVRDLILGRHAIDIDLTLEEGASTFARALAKRIDGRVRSYPQFLTYKVTADALPEIDIATPRKDPYSPPGALLAPALPGHGGSRCAADPRRAAGRRGARRPLRSAAGRPGDAAAAGSREAPARGRSGARPRGAVHRRAAHRQCVADRPRGLGLLAEARAQRGADRQRAAALHRRAGRGEVEPDA